MQFLWSSLLCINICLRKWLYCLGHEREEECAPISSCAIVSRETYRAARSPASHLGPALSAIYALFSGSLSIVLSYLSSSLLPAAVCILTLVCLLCPLLPSSSVLLFDLSTTARSLTLFFCWPVLRVSLFLSMSPPWGLCIGSSWWARPVSASWGRVRRVHQRTEGRSRRGRGPTPPGTGTQQPPGCWKSKLQHAALSADAGLCVSHCSIHNAVIAVFQKKGLADNELYVLNEGVR